MKERYHTSLGRSGTDFVVVRWRKGSLFSAVRSDANGTSRHSRRCDL